VFAQDRNGVIFGVIFNEKSIQKTVYKSIAKNMKCYAKILPKGRQDRYQNSSQINAKTGTEKNQENHEHHVFPMCKTMQIHCKGHRF
jgi:hypothetical protein